MTSSSSLALRIDAGAGFTSALDSIIFTLYYSPALWLDPDYTPSGTIQIVCRACAHIQQRWVSKGAQALQTISIVPDGV